MVKGWAGFMGVPGSSPNGDKKRKKKERKKVYTCASCAITDLPL